MYIKKVIIQGFGSYSRAENPELFQPGVNAILGVNGSGKSNFFKAIQFVLSPKYMHVDEEQMREFFHKGRNDAVTTARVDIIFDNTDERFPIESDEVTIRRTISGSTDSFYVNNRLYTKSEMESFLETAGFSRDNPYYMVEQGSVKQLCELSDEGRLRLLKEVAGTRVYEERRRESERILDDTQMKVSQVQDLIEEMNKSLGELESEKAELETYEKYDRERRLCVYFLASADIQEKENEINRCNVSRKTLADNLATLHKDYLKAKDTIATAEDTLATLTAESTSLTTTITQLEKERKSLLHEVTSLELDLGELRNALEREQERQTLAAQSSEVITAELESCQQTLQSLQPQLDDAVQVATQAESQWVARQTELETQRNLRRWKRQGTPEEQAQACARELEPLQKDAHDKQVMVETVQSQLASLEKEINMLQRVLDEKTKTKEELGQRQHALRGQLAEVRGLLETVTSDRKGLWRRNEEISGELEREETALQKESGSLNRLIPSDTQAGLDLLDSIPNIPPGGILGPVANLFRPTEDHYLTALEVTAAGRLFQIVVQNAEVASTVVEFCRTRRVGRLTLLPLNEMNDVVKSPRFPEDDQRCFPLINCIEFDESVRSIMLSVFGNTLLCENLQTATDVAREYNMNCVTLDGEKVGKRGAIRGGYQDSRSSRLRSWYNMQTRQETIREKKNEQNDIKGKLESIHQQELNALANETQITTAARLLTSTLSTTLAEEREVIDRLQQLSERRNQLIASLTAAQTAFRTAAGRVDQLQQQMDQPADLLEENDLRVLEERVAELERSKKEMGQRVEQLQLERVRVESRVTLLRKQALDLQQTTSRSDVHTDPSDEVFSSVSLSDIQSRDQQLQRRRAELQQVQQELSDLETRRGRLTAQQDREQLVLEQARGQEEQLEGKISSLRNRMQELLQKRNNALGLLEDKRRDVSVLSSIPAGSEEYREMTPNQLKSRLKKANKHLMKYDKVNRKALSQYVLFNERRSEFENRHRELQEGITSIRELISTLDERKNEAIIRTVKQVGLHFKETFQEMVPNGTAELIIRKESPESEQFSGVGIRVQFGAGSEAMRMGQLSGGQKSVVALALIFAIQRADPAPFYLMDEVDAELDTQYREMVAKLVHKQASQQTNVQIFCTTFKPEILEIADAYYRIAMKNEASRVEKTTRDDALEFVQTRLANTTQPPSSN